MKRIALIVEGDGDKRALPILLRRLNSDAVYEPVIPTSGRGSVLRSGGLENWLERLRRDSRVDGVLVLLDADKDCPKELACKLVARASSLGLPFPVGIVIANREYESWFLASLESLAGMGRLAADALYQGEVEEAANPKMVLNRFLPKHQPYAETVDQQDFSRRLDIARVEARSRSFRRLIHALEELFLPEHTTTPERCK